MAEQLVGLLVGQLVGHIRKNMFVMGQRKQQFELGRPSQFEYSSSRK